MAAKLRALFRWERWSGVISQMSIMSEFDTAMQPFVQSSRA